MLRFYLFFVPYIFHMVLFGCDDFDPFPFWSVHFGDEGYRGYSTAVVSKQAF